MISQVYEEMLQEGVRPDAVIYNTLISAYGRAGKWRQALHVSLRP
jgi:hypothetical protein